MPWLFSRSETSIPMARLDELERGVAVRGILPDHPITIVDVQRYGDFALTALTTLGCVVYDEEVAREYSAHR